MLKLNKRTVGFKQTRNDADKKDDDDEDDKDDNDVDDDDDHNDDDDDDDDHKVHAIKLIFVTGAGVIQNLKHQRTG